MYCQTFNGKVSILICFLPQLATTPTPAPHTDTPPHKSIKLVKISTQYRRYDNHCQYPCLTVVCHSISVTLLVLVSVSPQVICIFAIMLLFIIVS